MTVGELLTVLVHCDPRRLVAVVAYDVRWEVTEVRGEEDAGDDIELHIR